ncbi:MAG TPA: hypothetical protein VGQ76_14200 [Thermoanaerobaculia bacterium]|nr:hypothetical protein [Thermoanaerobaculia bacterium]
MDGDTRYWPALDSGGQELPEQITFERGMWGKVHGAPDFRWIATSPAFTAPQKRLEHELALGLEDIAETGVLWRVLGDTCYAIAFYPSGAIDAAGRRGFIEKQIVEWKRPAQAPAVAGALVLLPFVASLDAVDWGEAQPSDVHWSEDDHLMDLAASSAQVSAATIKSAIEEGLRGLREVFSEDLLTELYAALLAGNRAVPLTTPLPPAAVAALLLPLPRSVADNLSIVGRLPSTRLSESNVEDLRRCWDIVGGDTTAPRATTSATTGDQLVRARTMARSILTEIPLTTSSIPPDAASLNAVEIALWGPASAGKTALVAKLFLHGDGDENWEVFPTPGSLAFINSMRQRIQTENLFPKATTFGHVEGIEYVFTHRTSGLRSSLKLEDRAGEESERLDVETQDKVSLKKRLASAHGLVLLFDPLADEGALESSVSSALELLSATGRIGRKEERPIAVCVSKADVLIETPSDFRRALADPDTFVRERMSRALVRPLDHYCTNYRLFPVSAAGIRLRHGIIEPAVFYDEAFEPRICPGGQPFNLMAPFTWILNQVTGPR